MYEIIQLIKCIIFKQPEKMLALQAEGLLLKKKTHSSPTAHIKHSTPTTTIA